MTSTPVMTPASAVAPESRRPSPDVPAPSRGLARFGAVAFGLVVLSQVGAILASPPDAAMGHTQKIMYVHVPTAWSAFLAFFLVFVYSVRYLWGRAERSDRMALGAASSESA